jgi:hypothetical protein
MLCHIYMMVAQRVDFRILVTNQVLFLQPLKDRMAVQIIRRKSPDV